MSDTHPRQYRVKIDTAGRVVLPADFRHRWGLAPGDELVAEDSGAVLHVKTRDQVIREVQEYVRQFVPSGVSLVDELIKERREEVARGE